MVCGKNVVFHGEEIHILKVDFAFGNVAFFFNAVPVSG